MKIGVLVLNFDGADWLRQLLPTLREFEDPEAAVYLVDNGSVDQSVAVFQQYGPTGKLIQMSVNCGFASAYNLAIELAFADGCDWVCMLNNDTRVSKNWLAPIKRIHHEQPNVGIVGSAFRTWQGEGASAFMCARHPEGAARLGEPNCLDTDWVEGSALFMRRECWWMVGPMDPAYFMYWEEADLCRRARYFRWRVVVALDSVIEHYGGGSVTQTAAFRKPLLLRNAYVYKLTDPFNGFLVNNIKALRLLFSHFAEGFRQLNRWQMWRAALTGYVTAIADIKQVYRRYCLQRTGGRFTITDNQFLGFIEDIPEKQSR